MQATGIQVDGLIFRSASVRRTSQGIRIGDLKTQSLGDHVKPLYPNLDGGTPVSGLHSNDLIIRSVPLPANGGKKLRQALVLHTEANLHLKPEELISLCQIELKANQATIYSTTRTALASHLQEINQLGLDPERICPIPAALKTFIHWKAPEIESYFLVDIGSKKSNCIWVENGAVQSAHAIANGLGFLQSAFQEDRKKMISLKDRTEIDFSSLKSGQYPTLAEEARNLRREISKLLHSFQCRRPIIFTGELEGNGGFRDFLLELLRDCATEEVDINLSGDERRYAICLGLAIDYLTNREQPLQFRIGSSLSAKSWQKLGCIATGLLIASFFLSAIFYIIGSWWMDKRETEIVCSLEAWTASKDPALRQELFSASGKPRDLVAQWLKLIEKNAKDYPFLVKAPRVAQFLDWITRHPLIESFRLTGDPISFEQIRYQLITFPRLEAVQDPYLAKIELELKVTSPLHARKFHEALLQGEGMVDASREIAWEVFHDHYKASFYLKNENNGSF